MISWYPDIPISRDMLDITERACVKIKTFSKLLMLLWKRSIGKPRRRTFHIHLASLSAPAARLGTLFPRQQVMVLAPIFSARQLPALQGVCWVIYALLTVLQSFWRFLTKSCCPGWTRDAGGLGLLILVVVYCACLTACAVEEVAKRTANTCAPTLYLSFSTNKTSEVNLHRLWWVHL